MCNVNKINIRELLRLNKLKQVRPNHIVLGNRAKSKLGEIDNIFSLSYHPQFNGADELSFTVYKECDGKICRLWDSIVNFKLVWVKEYDEWFQITVQVDDSEKTAKKIITATSLCEAELSQRTITAEINTEDDIAREDYKAPTVFYNVNNTENSLLHRVLGDKCGDYTVKHVDVTLNNIQRSFSVDGESVYDFLTGTVAEEIGCLFLFDTNERGIYVYDIKTTCLDCGYRDDSDFITCPECKSTAVHYPYGNDTTILIEKNNLGNSVNLSVDTDSVKNCFNVTGGDDMVNATIKNINPNGSNRIYYFNEDTKADMPQKMIEKINAYDSLYDEYVNTKILSLDGDISSYNSIITNIKALYPATNFALLKSSYTGYSNLTSAYYDAIDAALYLKSKMMPTWDIADTTANEQLALLTTENLSPVAVTDVSTVSSYTADNAVLAMAKSLINTSLYKIEITESSLVSQQWKGKSKLTSYSSDEDIAENTEFVTVTINDDYKKYISQCIDRTMSKFNDMDINNIFELEELSEFKSELKKYCAARLTSFESAYRTVLNVLTEQGISNGNSELYDIYYTPYYNKLNAIQAELSVRNKEVDTVISVQESLQKLFVSVQNTLNFEKYMGPDLWQLFLSYIREDSYSNENYISDGLSNAELISSCKQLIEKAKGELVKSGEKQYSITSALTNLLLITDENNNCVFEPILDDFTLGNFIRCKIDGKLYKMRLTDIQIDYDNLTQLGVTFSDVIKSGSILDRQMRNTVKQVNSMATSYSSVKKQADKGEKANYSFERLQKEGLDSAQYNIFNTNSTVIVDEHGLLGRNYDDVNDVYSDEQVRLNGSDLVFTDDNWKTTKLAVGKQKFTLNGTEREVYGVNAQTVISGEIVAGNIYSANYSSDSAGNTVSGTFLDLNNGNFALGGGKIIFNSDTNKMTIKGVDIDWSTSTSPEMADIDGIEDLQSIVSYNTAKIDSNTAQIASNTAAIELNSTQIATKVTADDVSSMISQSADEIRLKADKIVWEALYSSMDEDGNFVCQNADISGKINATSGTIGGWTISEDTIKNNISSLGTEYAVGLTTHYDINSGQDPYFPHIPAIWAGGSIAETAPFSVSYDGYLQSKYGQIGGWYISENYLSSHNPTAGQGTGDSYEILLSTPNISNKAILVRQIDTEPNINWFYVTYDGFMYCNDGYFCTRNRNVDGKGIEIFQDHINMHAWADKDNLVGGLFTSYIDAGDSGGAQSKRQSLVLYTDYNDELHFDYTDINGKKYPAVIIDDDCDHKIHNMVNTVFHYPLQAPEGYGIECDSNFAVGNKGSSKITRFWCYNPDNDTESTNVRIFNGGDEAGKYYYNCEFSLWGTGRVKYNWHVNGTIYGNVSSDSDKNIKKDIKPLDIEKTSNFIYSLVPSEFRFKNGTSQRLHHGLIAQDVKESMGDDDWGVFVDKKINDENFKDVVGTEDYNSDEKVRSEQLTAQYGLRYDELIADLIATVQSQNERIKKLEQKTEQ